MSELARARARAAAPLEDLDRTDPPSMRPMPTADVLVIAPSEDGRDPTRDALAARFPQGVLVVDLRSYAPWLLRAG
jgi:hypothetical protein